MPIAQPYASGTSDKTIQPGGATDSANRPVVDPTANVQSLTEASNKRQDDLREAQEKYFASEIAHLNETAVLRAEHNAEMRRMEADRVDKIRSVDVANAAATAAQLVGAVNTLATTASATAETLRNQVAATAAAVASQTERVLGPIIERLTTLEKSNNFVQGRATVSDPALADLVIEIRKLSLGAATNTGTRAGTAAVIAFVMSGIFVLTGIGSLAISILSFKH